MILTEFKISLIPTIVYNSALPSHVKKRFALDGIRKALPVLLW